MRAETISGYSFSPSDLNVSGRTPGISAFLRTRNGADFVETTIRSHIGFYDEIVAVYNQCTDNTPEILERLAQEFAPKIRLFHYADRVEPLGSRGHATTPANAPGSMVNYSNFALARTRHQIVVKLDDDHLAIPDRVEAACRSFREGRADLKVMHCFSGMNIARDAEGRMGIPVAERVSGNGDIGYFRVAEDTAFYRDRRFERFGRGKLRRRFAGYLYWHLKFLKAGEGFLNYELAGNPESRFAKKHVEFGKTRLMTLPEAVKVMMPPDWTRYSTATIDKLSLNNTRDRAAMTAFPDASLVAALDRTAPGWREVPVLGDLHD
jgi:glycosyltransferase involved in cell wall biosynthesis